LGALVALVADGRRVRGKAVLTPHLAGAKTTVRPRGQETTG